MKRHIWIGATVFLCLLAARSYAEELAQSVERFIATMGEVPSFSYRYEGTLLDADSAQVKVEGQVAYTEGFRISAEATLQKGPTTRRHLVKSDGNTLYEVLTDQGAVTFLREADLADVREYFGKEFLPFTICRNRALQVSLLALTPLLDDFYSMSYVNDYKIGGRRMIVFEAQLTNELMERAGRFGNNPLIADLTYLAGQAGRIWFYLGPDDGLIYRLEVYKRTRGMLLTMDFKDYSGAELENADFLYHPPADVEVHRLSDDLKEGIREFQRSRASIPLEPGERLLPARLNPVAGFPIYLSAFKEAVLVILWHNAAPGRTQPDLPALEKAVLRQTGKPIYYVIVTDSRGAKAAQRGAFPVVVVARNPREDPAVMTLRLLGASSRVIVVEPGLRVSAVIPCDNPNWVELTERAFAEALEKTGVPDG